MPRHGKKYREAREKVDRTRRYELEEALGLVKELASAKFEETVEMAVRLGVNPRHADQMVRGSVVLPNGLGKAVRVLIFAKGEKVKEAQEAGADYVGGEELAERLLSEMSQPVGGGRYGLGPIARGVEGDSPLQDVGGSGSGLPLPVLLRACPALTDGVGGTNGLPVL
ncbi:MAG: hypothetical protein ACE5LX_03525, partial [Nitrospinota bacterium]